MAELSESIKKFFIFLEKLSHSWENVSKKVCKTLNEIDLLAEQLRAASSVGDEIRICQQFPSLREHVIFKTTMSLEQELRKIIQVVQELEEGTNKLNQLASLIDHQRSFVNKPALDTFSNSKIFEYVYDCRQYYQAQFSGLQNALKCLDFREPDSIQALRLSFTEDKDLKKHVLYCLQVGKHVEPEIDGELLKLAKTIL